LNILFTRKTALFFLGLFLSAPLFAQTAEKLEALLNERALNWSQAAAFILEASLEPAEEPAEISDPEDAFSFAAGNNWLPKDAAPEDPARLNGVALLLMKSFDIKGGIFYRAFNGPHHAYRELVYKKIIRGNTDPDMPVSGQQLLLMLSRILSLQEES